MRNPFIAGLRFGVITGLLLVLLTGSIVTSCKEREQASLRELGTGLLSQLFSDLATPANISELLKLKGDHAKLQFVLDKAEGRLDMLATLCKDAIETRDTAKLRQWVEQFLPTLSPLLDQYSAKEILRGIEKVSPRLSATLAAAIPKALAYLFDQGRIGAPTLDGLAKAHKLKLSDDELSLFADLLEREWKKAAPPVVSKEGEL